MNDSGAAIDFFAKLYILVSNYFKLNHKSLLLDIDLLLKGNLSFNTN